MRVLLDDRPTQAPRRAPLTDADLAALYAVPDGRRTWLRANFVCTVDGSAVGADGRSGSINTDADHVVFDLLRALSDAVLVGAGTLRAEGYGRLSPPTRFAQVRTREGVASDLTLVVVSRRGRVPTKIAESRRGPVILLTCEQADGLRAARETLGEDQVIVAGAAAVDLTAGIHALHRRGLARLLTEGGPGLFTDLLAAGLVDELDLTLSPSVVGGDGMRIAQGPHVRAGFTPYVMLEQDGSLMGRWLRG